MLAAQRPFRARKRNRSQRLLAAAKPARVREVPAMEKSMIGLRP